MFQMKDDGQVIDIEWVRAQFPEFAEPSLDGWAFFENAGGSYPCRQVVDRLTRFYTARKVQPYAPYPCRNWRVPRWTRRANGWP